jgi:hypothetical protein
MSRPYKKHLPAARFQTGFGYRGGRRPPCHSFPMFLRGTVPEGYSFVLLKIEYGQNLMPANGVNNEEALEENAGTGRYSFVPLFSRKQSNAEAWSRRLSRSISSPQGDIVPAWRSPWDEASMQGSSGSSETSGTLRGR